MFVYGALPEKRLVLALKVESSSSLVLSNHVLALLAALLGNGEYEIHP